MKIETSMNDESLIYTKLEVHCSASEDVSHQHCHACVRRSPLDHHLLLHTFRWTT